MEENLVRSNCSGQEAALFRSPFFFFISALTYVAGGSSLAMAQPMHPLSTLDVLKTVEVDSVAESPDGSALAIVLQRPALNGEVYGRTAYEIDPTRADVWIISPDHDVSQNITNGRAMAAGFWCATWSPNGDRLAMLSTASEGAEPRGGDNVRLYVWNRSNGDLKRISDIAISTQPRLNNERELDIRSQTSLGESTQRCNESFENTPFTWLDNDLILAVALPYGRTSGIIDDFSRPLEHALSTQQNIKLGMSATASSSISGFGTSVSYESKEDIELRIFDIKRDRSDLIDTISTYPFKGALSVSRSPDGHSFAVLSPIGSEISRPGNVVQDPGWDSVKRLGISNHGKVYWLDLPKGAAYPLELLSWSPDSGLIAIRARPHLSSVKSSIFWVDRNTLRVQKMSENLDIGVDDVTPHARNLPAYWLTNQMMLVYNKGVSDQLGSWWILSRSSNPIPIDMPESSQPSSLVRTHSGTLVGVVGSSLVQFSEDKAVFLRVSHDVGLPSRNLKVVGDRKFDQSIILSARVDGVQQFKSVNILDGKITDEFSIPPNAKIQKISENFVTYIDPKKTGSEIIRRDFRTRIKKEIFSFNRHLSLVNWGNTGTIDYFDKNGRDLIASVIYPPDYNPLSKYPVITWIYGGYVARKMNDYWTDPYLPGIYNLYLYAALGYVILIPSIPLSRMANADMLQEITDGVTPAVDRLISLGVADPKRIGVMGQSFGGYSVLSLITRSRLFASAVSIAGTSDLRQYYYQFDPTARGYPGIEHKKSMNWQISEGVMGAGAPPYAHNDFYERNSPISYVSAVTTPVMLIHGELDVRDSLNQSESFFYALYRQNKKAKIIRYWGESHSLSQSPSNILDIVQNIGDWFSGMSE